MNDRYQVTVGNIGTVYSGVIKASAVECFEEYRRKSIEGDGRAAGEPVTLWCDGEIEREHEGEADREDSEDLPIPKCKRPIANWRRDRWGRLEAVDCNCPDCQALQDAIDSQPFEIEITKGEGLEGGGYEIEVIRRPPPEFADVYGRGKGYYCDGDLEYVVGSLRDLNCDDGAHAWFAGVYSSGDWPEVYGDHAGGWFRLQYDGTSGDRDTDCYCGPNGFGRDVPPGMYPDDASGDLKVCPDCGGRGYRNVPAYRIAIYGDRMDTAEAAGRAIETILEGRYPGVSYEWAEDDAIAFDVSTGYLYAHPWNHKCDDPGPEDHDLAQSFLVPTPFGTYVVRYFAPTAEVAQ